MTVAAGVYTFVSHETRSPIVSGNSTLIVGTDAALVVDTGQFPELARRMIADVKRLTNKPVKVVVNTHWHNDHVFGNATYKEAFPGVELLAHEETLRLLLKNGPKQVETYRTKVGPFVASLKDTLRAGKGEKGQPLDALEIADLKEKIADGDAAIPLWKDVVFTPPTRTFKDQTTVALGGRDVVVAHLGRGNTAGDAVVYVPDAKVLVTGDVVVAPTPYAIGSYPREWIAVLGKLGAFDATAFVPGHGPVMHDTHYMGLVAELLRAVDTQVAAAAKGGASLDETRKKVELGALRQKVAGDDAARLRSLHDFFEVPAVGRAYEESTGTLADE